MNPDSKNYYERLGVDKSADYNVIRKAYRKACLKFHPDRNKDDPRAERYGEDGLKGGGGGGGFPFGGGLFGNFFGGGGGDPFFGGQRQRKKQMRKTPSIKRPLTVTLEDVYCGVLKKVQVQRKRFCVKCNGKGSTKKNANTHCDKCDGKGKVIHIQQMGPGFVSKSIGICPKCQGEGKIIDPKFRCKDCNGSCIVNEKKTLEVNVDKGMRTGQKIEFEGEADDMRGYDKAGDIIFVIQVQEHARFKLKGLNLEMKKVINLSEALTGVEFIITHLDERILYVKSKKRDVIKPRMVKQIDEEGMPVYKRPYEKGNLHIEFEIEFPIRIPKEIQDKLVSMLPKKKAIEPPVTKKGQVIEEVILKEKKEQEKGKKYKNVYDEDDEDDKEHRQGITCSIQ